MPTKTLKCESSTPSYEFATKTEVGTTIYSRLIVLQNILGSFNSRIIDDDELEIHGLGDRGLKTMRVRINERTVGFEITLPFDLKADNKETALTINRLNNQLRESRHGAAWSIDEFGKVRLFTLLIDDGHLDSMPIPVQYLVSDMVEIAEDGFQSLENELNDHYVPSGSEPRYMYR